jgi:hypothetical protein
MTGRPWESRARWTPVEEKVRSVIQKPYEQKLGMRMKRIALEVLLVGLLSSLFGCGKGDSRFVSEKDYQTNLIKQTRMSPETLRQLRQYDVTEKTELKLEFLFYTDTQPKASALARRLEGLGYAVEHGPSADNEKLFDITGWTTKMPMSESRVVNWTQQMCQIAFEHDCDFDGWGTYPEQE